MARIYPDLETWARESGESLTALARRLDISLSMLSLIKSGRRTPSLPLARRISRVARVPIESLDRKAA